MVTRSIKPVLCVYRVTSDTYREPKGEFIMLYLSILSITCILRPPPAYIVCGLNGLVISRENTKIGKHYAR
jgi:hypothetical protein